MSETDALALLELNSNNPSKLALANFATTDSYLSYINKVPFLTELEELTYAKQFFEEGNLHAAHRLVIAHLRYVVKVAKNYLGYGLPLADLIQEGTIGLMKAVRKFDYTKKVRLVTFALHWIKSEIHEFILKNWRIVKIATTKAQRKLFFKLRSNKKSINHLTNEEIQGLAIDLKVRPKDVKQMELRIFNYDSSFDEPEGGDSVNSEQSQQHLVPANYLEDRKFNPEAALEKYEDESLRFKLHRAIAKLSPRHQDILKQRWLQDSSKLKLQDLATKYGVSKERIRQIETQAIMMLRKSLGEYEYI